MQNKVLQPFFDALKAGKTISCYSSDSNSGYINQYYVLARYDRTKGKVYVETKDVVDGGYPDIEITNEDLEMDWEAFERWFEPWASKTNQIKIE